MAGYSGTPLVKKLGIKPGHKIYVKNQPENYYSLVGSLDEQVNVLKRLSSEIDLIHIFTRSKTELSKSLNLYLDKIKTNGCIWVSWPKKSSKIPSEVTEDTVREVALPLGLVDIKVCAVDEIWSGLKLVIRKENRA